MEWETLCENCLYSELFCSAFSRIRTEYREILGISPYSVRMRKNGDQNNCEYDTFYAVKRERILDLILTGLAKCLK